MSINIFALIAAEAVMNTPVTVALAKFMIPMRIAADGTAFAGQLARWQVGTVTGRVAGINSWTDVVPIVHTTLLLVDADQRQHTVYLVNSDDIFGGQVVTACYARRGRATRLFAVLNHSTGEPTVIVNAMERVTRLTPWRGIFMVALSILSVFGIPLIIILVVLWKRRLRQFACEGIAPLWELTGPIAGKTQ